MRIRPLGELLANPGFRTEVDDATLVSVVNVELPGKVVRVNITLDENALDLINRAAEAAGETRSRFLVEAAKERIARIQAVAEDRLAGHAMRLAERAGLQGETLEEAAQRSSAMQEVARYVGKQPRRKRQKSAAQQKQRA